MNAGYSDQVITREACEPEMFVLKVTDLEAVGFEGHQPSGSSKWLIAERSDSFPGSIKSPI